MPGWDRCGIVPGTPPGADVGGRTHSVVHLAVGQVGILGSASGSDPDGPDSPSLLHPHLGICVVPVEPAEGPHPHSRTVIWACCRLSGHTVGGRPPPFGCIFGLDPWMLMDFVSFRTKKEKNIFVSIFTFKPVLLWSVYLKLIKIRTEDSELGGGCMLLIFFKVSKRLNLQHYTVSHFILQ